MEFFEDGDGTRVILIDGEFPSRSEMNNALNVCAAIQIDRLPSGYDDLRLLEPFLEKIVDLRLFAAALTSAPQVALMRSLKRLTLDQQLSIKPIAIPSLHALEYYRGPLAAAPSIFKLMSLCDVDVSATSVQVELGNPNLRKLHVYTTGALSDLSQITNSGNLTHLGYAGPKVISLKGVERFPLLERLSIAHTGRLQGVDTLKKLPALRRLDLTDVRNVDSVLDVADANFTVSLLRSTPKSQRAILRKVTNFELLE